MLLLTIQNFDGPALASAQEKWESSFYLVAGRTTLANNDRLASPLRYTGSGAYPGLIISLKHRGYQGALTLTYQNVHLRSAISDQPVEGNHRAETTSLQGTLTFMKKRASDTGRWLTYYGLWGEGAFLFREYFYENYLPSETVAEFVTGLGPSFKFAWAHPQYELNIQVQTYLVGWIFRNPYSLTTDALSSTATKKSFLAGYLDLAKFTTISDLQRIQFNATYSRNLKSKLRFLVSIGTTYSHFTGPWDSTTWERHGNIGIGISF